MAVNSRKPTSERPVAGLLPGHRAVLLACAAVLVLATGAAAQENNRGLPDPNADPVKSMEAAPFYARKKPVPTDTSEGFNIDYKPISPGALPDAPASDATSDTEAAPTATTSTSGSSLFDQLDAAATPDDGADAPRRLPTTARDRARERKSATTTAVDAPVPPVRPLDGTVTGTVATGEEADAETTGRVQRQPREDQPPIDPGAEAEAPVETPLPEPEENPYEAIGIRAGTFILRPSVETGLTQTTNADSSVDGGEALLSETTLRLNAQSDWSRHSATVDAYGTFSKSLSGEDVEETEAGLDAALRLDLADSWSALGTLGYSRKPDSAASAVQIGDAVSQPLLQTFSASAGLRKDVGKARLGLTGRLDRNDYGDADLADGTVLSQEERNVVLGTLLLRGGYEISPALIPFVELEVGRRKYDQEADSAGYRRSTDRYGIRGGTELNLSDKITGELSAGWITEQFDDERLEDLSGLSLAADLRWSPERETTLALNALTTVEGTTTPGASGSILHSATLTLERNIRANLTGNVFVGGGLRDFIGQDGRDELLNAGVGATWWLNRYAGITGRVRYEQLSSDLPGRDYDTTSYFLGLKLQR